MKHEAISKCSSEFSVVKMCKALGLKQSGFYQWRKGDKRRQTKREKDKELIQIVIDVFTENHRTYGYRRMYQILSTKGVGISEYGVRRVMQENGLYPVTIRKYKPYPKQKGDRRYSDNIVQQDFNVDKANRCWAGDITYIKTFVGWVYLAVVIDLYNREVVGYSISKKPGTELVKRALGNALAKRRSCRNLTFHSDRGCQYSSIGFRKMLEENNIKGSMSKSGCPFDNSCVESFFATTKKEFIYRKRYATMEEVERDMFEYIELFYNRKRIHSTLGYLSPVEYRMRKEGERGA
jgi:transposase InsO family protein